MTFGHEVKVMLKKFFLKNPQIVRKESFVIFCASVIIRLKRLLKSNIIVRCFMAFESLHSQICHL